MPLPPPPLTEVPPNAVTPLPEFRSGPAHPPAGGQDGAGGASGASGPAAAFRLDGRAGDHPAAPTVVPKTWRALLLMLPPPEGGAQLAVRSAALALATVLATRTVSAAMLVAVSTLVAPVPSLITPMWSGSGLARPVCPASTRLGLANFPRRPRPTPPSPPRARVVRSVACPSGCHPSQRGVRRQPALVRVAYGRRPPWIVPSIGGVPSAWSFHLDRRAGRRRRPGWGRRAHLTNTALVLSGTRAFLRPRPEGLSTDQRSDPPRGFGSSLTALGTGMGWTGLGALSACCAGGSGVRGRRDPFRRLPTCPGSFARMR